MMSYSGKSQGTMMIVLRPTNWVRTMGWGPCVAAPQPQTIANQLMENASDYCDENW